jgi:hypothetical protein
MRGRNMAKLKLVAIPDDKPVKMTFELPASTHRDLLAYAEAIGRETGQTITDPSRLIAPMLLRFMSTDRAFIKMRRSASLLSGQNDETHMAITQPDKTS